jgi:hypothetical protein
METGTLKMMHLKRYWSKAMLKRANLINTGNYRDEGHIDKILLYALGLGLEQTVKYLFNTAPEFDEFEDWIIKTAGRPQADTIERFNSLFSHDKSKSAQIIPQVLSDEELKFFDQHGYIIIKNAVSKTDCDRTIAALCNFIDIDRNDPSTWYNANQGKQGIMVQLFQDPIMQKNRASVKIREAFEQLWQRTDLWAYADRVGFNPPETKGWKFPGPYMHWDVSLKLPIPFGLQGILYLADTEENQGAFTLVPGFQNRIDDWIHSLPAGTNPRNEDLHALGSKPIAAQAGDFIIWSNALPHGSSPNANTKPRFVQYINYAPADPVIAEEWI